MQRCLLTLVITFFSLLAGSFAYADYGCMSAPFGWYLELNIGSTHVSNVSYPGKSSTSGLGGNLNVGYKFMPYFALEAGYTRYASTTLTDPSTDTKAANIKHYSWDLAARGILPMSYSGFELFAKLGVQRNSADVSIDDTQAAANIGVGSTNHRDTALYMGAGAQYYFWPEFAGVLQWQRAEGNGNVGVLDLYSIGFSYLFA